VHSINSDTPAVPEEAGQSQPGGLDAPPASPAVPPAQPDRVSAVNVGQEHDVVHLRHSSERASDFSKETLTKAFVLGFPFGLGGPETGRPVPVSREQCVAHCLRVSNHHFHSSRNFLFANFDAISRLRTVHAINRYNLSHAGDLQALSRLTPQETCKAVTEAMTYKSACLKAARSGQGTMPLRQSGTSALGAKLLAAANTGERVAFASNGERKTTRDHLWAMCLVLGLFGVYVTVNLSDVVDPLVFHYVTERGSFMGSHPAGQPPLFPEVTSRSERLRLLAKQPVLTTRWAIKTFEIFFSKVLRFDMKQQRAEKEPGLFGHVEAIYGNMETQQRDKSWSNVVFAYTCTHTRTYTHTHTCTYIYIYICTRTHIHTCIRTHVHTYPHIHKRPHTHTYIHAHTHIHTCARAQQRHIHSTYPYIGSLFDCRFLAYACCGLDPWCSANSS